VVCRIIISPPKWWVSSDLERLVSFIHNNNFDSSYYITWNMRTIGEWRTGKCVVGSGCGLIRCTVLAFAWWRRWKWRKH
jgi:hypothetical protein